ncbi:cytochrome c biogenesis protein CcsA [Geobacter argillaceus]|uniref:Heme exporter protein C n=1 Tax=Geobacter argillaceus TaxID=345631 RepID=A0A562V921_9BACT|nr:cytochrome c biogenesis protein CcsA [Geobacter argillaceus]TWJ14298.1 cytochrome c-type biogenesis protein CcsB [Geobacter argillaceus]
MIEVVFFWLAVAGYVASSIGYMISQLFGMDRFRRGAIFAAVTGLVFHSVSLGVRWNETGHGPYISTYEILSSDVWIAVLFFLLLQWRSRKLAGLGILVMPLSFLMMGFALTGSRDVRLLPPTLRSAWLVVHVVFAKLTVAAMLMAVALSIGYLLKRKRDGAGSVLLARLPDGRVLNDFIYRMVVFGFIALTIMIITGVIWGNYSWGSYWSWDPAQTWSLVVWFVYGSYLHGRMTFRWSGTLSAWFVIFAFVFSVFAFFVMPYFVKDLHSQYMAR